MGKLALHPDRLFPADPDTRAIARRLYGEIADMPIISPHGHTDPRWFAYDEAFPNPAALMIQPDHYVFRMLYSQGIPLEALGIAPHTPRPGGPEVEADPRKVWQIYAENYHLFRGTPSRMWHDWIYSEIFRMDEVLTGANAGAYYDAMEDWLATEEARPRALMDSFNIDFIATTEDALDPLTHHAKINADGWGKRVVTTFRPDNVIDPEYENFNANLDRLGEISGCDTKTYSGYIAALENRRAFFKEMGATATDHSQLTIATYDLSPEEAERRFDAIRAGDITPESAEIFRGHMLMEMARMSLEDGLTMQLHCGIVRNHNGPVFAHFGRDKGGDIPLATEYNAALRPLLNKYGNEPGLTIIVFTLDETSYSRELAPLAGHYPALKLGPAWWFQDSPEGMRRFREMMTETAGFYNTVGFNDDTRAFLSIPARHDVARRMDAGFLARLVAEHRLPEDEAREVAVDLTGRLVREAYNLV